MSTSLVAGVNMAEELDKGNFSSDCQGRLQGDPAPTSNEASSRVAEFYINSDEAEFQANNGQDSSGSDSSGSNSTNRTRQTRHDIRDVTTERNEAFDPSPLSYSSTLPELDHIRDSLPFRNRANSAPTFIEHHVGLVLRSISDEFNQFYDFPQNGSQRNAASLPQPRPSLLSNMFERISSQGHNHVASYPSHNSHAITARARPIPRSRHYSIRETLEQRLSVSSVPEVSSSDEMDDND